MSRQPRFRCFSLFMVVLLLSFATVANAAARPVAPPQPPAAPPNDEQSTATQIRSLPYTGTQNTDGATYSPKDPDCDGLSPAIDHHSVWHEFHWTSSTLDVNVSTLGSDYDTVLSVYRVDGADRTGIGMRLTQVACSDDAEGGLQSHLYFTPEVGKTYVILTAGFEFASGTLVLRVRSEEPI